MGIEEVLIAPQSPWQNPFVERWIGTLRRECLDHVIVLNEAHLNRIVCAFWNTIIGRGRTARSLRMHRSRAPSSHRSRAGSWPSRYSVACIIATAAAPDPAHQLQRLPSPP